MKKLMMLAAMAIFCVSMNAQEPQKKECCKKEKTECCDKKDKKECKKDCKKDCKQACDKAKCGDCKKDWNFSGTGI